MKKPNKHTLALLEITEWAKENPKHQTNKGVQIDYSPINYFKYEKTLLGQYIRDNFYIICDNYRDFEKRRLNRNY